MIAKTRSHFLTRKVFAWKAWKEKVNEKMTHVLPVPQFQSSSVK